MIRTARPLFNSIARFCNLASASNESLENRVRDHVGRMNKSATYHPKSIAPLRKSPTNSPPVMSFITPSSNAPMNAMIWIKPACGMALKAAKPLGMSVNWVPSYEISPGRRHPASWAKYPATANMEMPESLIGEKAASIPPTNRSLTAVLDFNVSQSVKLGLISVGNKAQRIIESKRGLRT